MNILERENTPVSVRPFPSRAQPFSANCSPHCPADDQMFIHWIFFFNVLIFWVEFDSWHSRLLLPINLFIFLWYKEKKHGGSINTMHLYLIKIWIKVKTEGTSLKVDSVSDYTISLTNPFQGWNISLVLLMTLGFIEWGLHTELYLIDLHVDLRAA